MTYKKQLYLSTTFKFNTAIKAYLKINMFKRVSVLSVLLVLLWACSEDSSVNSTNSELEKLSSSQSISSSSFKSSSSAEKLSSLYEEPVAEVIDGKITDSRDGQVYPVVTIGDQTWMAANLNFAVDSSWCYNDSLEYCEKKGRLYQWHAAMDLSTYYIHSYFDSKDTVKNHRGICPKGWHVPKEYEFNILEHFIQFNLDRGASCAFLKVSEWESFKETCADITPSGFDAIPSGVREVYPGVTAAYKVGFVGIDAVTIFWTASEINSGSSYTYKYIDTYMCNFMGFTYNNPDSRTAASLRCVKD